MAHSRIAAIAHREGWNVQDMQRSPSFSTLLRIKNLSLVILLDQGASKPNFFAGVDIHHILLDIEIIRPELEAQIIQSQGQRERSDAEKGYQKRRRDVEAYYNRIRSAEPAKIMPTLQEFRKLPTVQLMEKNDSRITGIAKDLQHITVKSLLLHDLEIWEKDTQERLAETLGYKGWKSASSLKLHPTQRLTARFRCTRCDAAFPAGRFDDRGFTLSETCLHCCKPNNRKEKSKGVWSTELFVGDQKVKLFPKFSQLISVVYSVV